MLASVNMLRCRISLSYAMLLILLRTSYSSCFCLSVSSRKSFAYLLR